MRSFRGFYLAVAIALVSALCYVVSAFKFLLEPLEPRLAVDGFSPEPAAAFSPVEPAILQSLRHEARVHRRSSDRKT